MAEPFVKEPVKPDGLLGFYNDSNGSYYAFVGALANKINFTAIAINDAGQVLGDANSISSLGYGVLKADIYSAHLMQSKSGFSVVSPFVLTGSTQQPLQGIQGTTAINLTGFDEEG